MDNWKRYKRIGEIDARPYEEGENTAAITISDVNVAGGSPRLGDMIARNPDDTADQWLISKELFDKSYAVEVSERLDGDDDEDEDEEFA